MNHTEFSEKLQNISDLNIKQISLKDSKANEYASLFMQASVFAVSFLLAIIATFLGLLPSFRACLLGACAAAISFPLFNMLVPELKSASKFLSCLAVFAAVSYFAKDFFGSNLLLPILGLALANIAFAFKCFIFGKMN